MLNEFVERFLTNFQNVSDEPKFILLIFLIIILVVGRMFKRIGFPVILGEMIAGLILGPPVLGWIQPNEHIEFLAELGVFFIMLLTGLRVDLTEIRKTSFAAIGVAAGGTIIPFALGVGIAQYFGAELYESLFIGIGLSVTSIATKGKLLHEVGILQSRSGAIMVNAAIYDNIFSLILFSIIVSFVKTGTIDVKNLFFIIFEISIFFAVTFGVGIYVMPKIKHFFRVRSTYSFTLSIVIALMFGAFSELLGMHRIIGFFFAGLFIQKVLNDIEQRDKYIMDTLNILSFAFLGPLFFITLSFHVDFTSVLNMPPSYTILLCLAAILGKVIGAGFLNYITGGGLRESLIIGFGMNGRGMTEVILLMVGNELGVLNDDIISIFVFLIILTNLIVPFALKLLTPKEQNSPKNIKPL